VLPNDSLLCESQTPKVCALTNTDKINTLFRTCSTQVLYINSYIFAEVGFPLKNNSIQV